MRLYFQIEHSVFTREKVMQNTKDKMKMAKQEEDRLRQLHVKAEEARDEAAAQRTMKAQKMKAKEEKHKKEALLSPSTRSNIPARNAAEALSANDPWAGGRWPAPGGALNPASGLCISKIIALHI